MCLCSEAASAPSGDAVTKLSAAVIKEWLEDTAPTVAPRPNLLRRARQLHAVLVAPARLLTPEARFHTLSSAPRESLPHTHTHTRWLCTLTLSAPCALIVPCVVLFVALLLLCARVC